VKKDIKFYGMIFQKYRDAPWLLEKLVKEINKSKEK